MHGLVQRLIWVCVDLVRPCMDKRDGDALLVEGPTHVGVQRDNPDAANGTCTGQDDPVGLRGQDIASRQRMFGDKGLHRLLRPGGPDAVCQIEGPGDLTPKAVDVEGNAAHGWVGQGRLQLRRNAFV